MYGILTHISGKMIKRPTIIIIIPENTVQNNLGISIISVVACKVIVKIIIETASDKIIVKDFLEILFSPFSDDTTMIGKSGNMHGAKTVNIPASTEIIKKVILLYL